MIRENLDHILPFISLSFATHSSTDLTIACTAKICDAIRSSAEFGSSVSHFSFLNDGPRCGVLRFVFLFRLCFPWARLRDNSCARQLRVFCFPGSSL
jgi:hypothetical protein